MESLQTGNLLNFYGRDAMCSNFGVIYIKEWKKVPFFMNAGAICDWFTA